MGQVFITCLLWFGAIGCGLMAGLYFAFSTFIMTALRRLGQAQGIEAMNSMNSTIVRSMFMPVFLGTTLSSLTLAIYGLVNNDEPGAIVMLTGGLIYMLGMFVCTMACNVPLNNALAAADPTSKASAPVWSRYLRFWTLWNHVRTISSIAATALYVVAISMRGLHG
jgi:uncharacterized membrane protein